MKKINKSIDINTSREVIWAAIINHTKYQLWTVAFHEGSYFEGGWQSILNNFKKVVENKIV